VSYSSSSKVMEEDVGRNSGCSSPPESSSSVSCHLSSRFLCSQSSLCASSSATAGASLPRYVLKRNTNVGCVQRSLVKRSLILNRSLPLANSLRSAHSIFLWAFLEQAVLEEALSHLGHVRSSLALCGGLPLVQARYWPVGQTPDFNW